MAIALVGLGGERFYEAHVEATTSLLKELNPPGVAFSDLVVVPGTPYTRLVEKGILDVLSPARMTVQRLAFEQIALTAPQYDYEVNGSKVRLRCTPSAMEARLAPASQPHRRAQLRSAPLRTLRGWWV